MGIEMDSEMDSELFKYFSTPFSQNIDREVCSESKCSECGHEGLGYRPDYSNGSYRAFSVCPECGYEEEF